MIRLVNRITGGEMWVHESRLEEYMAAGHKLAAPPPAPEKQPAKKPAARKSTAKK